jgi:pSer/pThr/pTyr-binding forkhead associated (FHA) protein
MGGIPKLIVLSEKMRGKSFELIKDIHTAGRSDERDICIKDPTISSHHCDFIKTESTYILRDNDSTNGTRVNNVQITVEDYELKNSDIIQLGAVEILYDCEDKSVTTITRTQTGIDLNNSEGGLSTVRDMENFSPFARKDSKNALSQKVLVAVIGLTVLGIVAVLGYIGYLIFR